MAKKRRIRRKIVEKILDTPSFLPGIRGKNWIVREAPAHVTPNTINNMGEYARMEIPTGNTQWERYNRLHELLHAAISPLQQPRDVTFSNGEVASAQGILLAEEVRVEAISRQKLGIDQLPAKIDEIAKKAITQLMPLMIESGGTKYVDTILNTVFACWMGSGAHLRDTAALQHMRGFLGSLEGSGTFNEAQMKSAWNVVSYIEHGLSQILDDIWFHELQKLFDPDSQVPNWKSTVKLGYFITKLIDNTKLAQPPSTEGIAMEMPDMAEPAQWVEDHGGGHGESVISETMGDWNSDRLEQREQDPERFVRKKPTEEKVTWGEMTIIERKRPYRLPKTKVQRSKYTATDAGTHPKYIHRILIDGMPFARKRREPGGGVLIDDSGSMSFATSEIQAVVEAAPAVDIAAYSGGGSKGELVIVSKGGTWMRVDEHTRPVGYNNIVDMPALEWLAQQNEPRIWVSDGLAVPVTGGMDKAILDCIEFCKRNKINRVANMYDARDVFLGRKEIYR